MAGPAATHTDSVHTEKSPSGGRDAALDGLRGLAVLMVVYYHYVLVTGLLVMPGNGYLGVVVFFVLSGYLITRILWRAEPSAASYRRFISRRVRRLYPALLGLLIAGVPVMAACGPETLRHDLASAAFALAQATAFVHIGGWHHSGALEPTWSLTVEWCFYLLWPIVLFGMSRRRLSARSAATVTACAAAVLYAAALPLAPRAFAQLPVANIGVMLAGAALALVHLDRRNNARQAGRDPGIVVLALLLLVVMTLIPGVGSASPGYRYLLMPATVIAASIVIDAKPGTGGFATSLLKSRVMRGLGLTSYSIYLWNVPVIWSVWFVLPDVSARSRVGIAVLVLAGVVWLSYQLLEKPALRATGVRSTQSRPRENVASRS